jgi:hypothetical protein
VNIRIVSKNQYPYQTVHTVDCPQGLRSHYSYLLGEDRIATMDTIRTDWCSRCFGKEYYKSPVWAAMTRIRNEYDKRRSEEAKADRFAREVAALRLALQAREKDPLYADENVRIAINGYAANARDGYYTPLTVTFEKGTY